MKIAIALLAALLATAGPAAAATTAQEETCLSAGGVADHTSVTFTMGIKLDSQPTCDEATLEAQMDAAAAELLEDMPSSETVQGGVTLTAMACAIDSDESGDSAGRRLAPFRAFDWTWYRIWLASLAGTCMSCTDGTAGNRNLRNTGNDTSNNDNNNKNGGGHRKAAEMEDCGCHLETPGSTTFAFPEAATISKIGLSGPAYLTLTAADGSHTTMSAGAGETDLTAEDVTAVAISGEATIDSLIYCLPACPTTEAALAEQIAALELAIAAKMEAAVADKPCIAAAGPHAVIQATPAEHTVLCQ